VCANVAIALVHEEQREGAHELDRIQGEVVQKPPLQDAVSNPFLSLSLKNMATDQE
jgi:hypothetical protein